MTNTPLPFRVADGWPYRKAAAAVQAQAVQALVANHTLIVGQSRSGKTNAARRLLEEILTWTETKVVILDPNADFRLLDRLQAPRKDMDFAQRWPSIADKIGFATPERAWGIRWGRLSLSEMAAFLRLSPKDAFGEYRHLDRHYMYDKAHGRLHDSTLEDFAKSPYFALAVGEELERYRLLLQELSTRRVWATPNTQSDLDSLFAEEHRAVVVDLSLDDEEVRTITAARTLELLWRDGEARRKAFLKSKNKPWHGTLVVIDEAHLFAPPSTDDPQKRAVCERIERFADQGKKLNLYLMVITQQPGKLHRGVLAECNNRLILRVNERLSLKVLEDTYGGIRGRFDGALTFNPGQALVEGALLCDETPPPATPRGAQFLMARTREGGGTPQAAWARPLLLETHPHRIRGRRKS
jgi:DNA helicase HerA-like ATPase